ncbi:DUF3307 domain-containing protein [Chitinophaga sp. sic0106]|uniref:DUF3307 domain-containing protein n=1 Tax=Chitinophaga sp. sic0106 TaxID=2854785 RepID=UPI001C482E64|nr:DUF3307 domain-containing protein [Chitinophaga sp. sic0106]MBV7532840.1 DUF3307 domain-containing protein [Chitinophaga sp. sic0106]
MDNSYIWLTKIILAHMLSDFFFQKNSWVKDREKRRLVSPYLYLHILITAITAIVMVGFVYWKTILIITCSHYVIDLLKSYAKPSFKTFIIDQIAHLLVLILCWSMVFEKFPSLNTLSNFYHSSQFWILGAAIYFLTFPSSIIVGQATRKWSTQLLDQSTAIPNPSLGLLNAGKYIGIIERLLICFLVYQNQYEAVGLFITGKSILRYNSQNEEVKTEYLLVGTLVSMLLAFSVAILLKQIPLFFS